MTTKFAMVRDINGFNGFGLMPCDDTYTVNLTQGTATSVTVPSAFNNYLAIMSFTPGSSVWVAYKGNTATAPIGANFAASTSELLPTARFVQYYGTTSTQNTMSFLATTASTSVTVLFYALD